MGEKRVIILKKRPLTVKAIHKKPEKVKKPTKGELLAERGLRYCVFVQDIHVFQKWVDIVLKTGKTPNDRFRELIENDISIDNERNSIDYIKAQELFMDDDEYSGAGRG